ncbi:hypothetical protein V1509DRAFT_643060 [Lipomyces kononenkoae]
MSVTLSTENSPVQHEASLSKFDKALDLLESNPPEQRLDMQMPRQEVLAYEMRVLTETVTILTVPKDLHEVAASELRHQIIKSIDEYLFRHSPESIGRIVDAGSIGVRGSDGGYSCQ